MIKVVLEIVTYRKLFSSIDHLSSQKCRYGERVQKLILTNLLQWATTRSPRLELTASRLIWMSTKETSLDSTSQDRVSFHLMDLNAQQQDQFTSVNHPSHQLRSEHLSSLKKRKKDGTHAEHMLKLPSSKLE